MQTIQHQAKEYAQALWNDPKSSPVCQYLEDNEKTFLAGAAAGVKAEWEEIHRWFPTLHFCADWDFLLIDDRSPEYESCHCMGFGGKSGAV